jgi:prolyl-tRNA editing enzyme YbaK/EbsC (Cys-tRNA(Pro) deacylase)
MTDASTSLSASKPPASIALEKLGIPHRVFKHETPVTSFEQAAVDRGQRPGQIVRSILFQIRPEEYLMVLVAGPDQIDWKKLRQFVKRSRVRMATEEEVLEVTDTASGRYRSDCRATQSSDRCERFEEAEVSIGSGVRNMAIIMKSDDLRNALRDAEIVSLME